MTPDEFRAAGHALIDWIADYRAGLAERPVRAQVAPGEVRAALPAQPSPAVEPFAALLGDLERVVVPGMTLVQHPMHFGWFPSNASLESVLGDLASSGLGGLGISWESCPALTEVEEVVVDWLRQLTGLSEAWSGTIHDTASTATLTALLAARERASDHAQTRAGLAGTAPLVVYTSAQAHSSVKKAALLAGYGLEHLRSVPCDPETYALLPAALAEQIRTDRAAGLRPCAVVATTGTTASTAMDPLAEIAAVCEEHGLWLHVDAAMAGTAMLLPERRHLWEGVEQADSLTWNPHKWLGTILDCSLFYVRDPEHLVRVMSTNPSYLRSAEDGQVTSSATGGSRSGAASARSSSGSSSGWRGSRRSRPASGETWATPSGWQPRSGRPRAGSSQRPSRCRPSASGTSRGRSRATPSTSTIEPGPSRSTARGRPS